MSDTANTDSTETDAPHGNESGAESEETPTIESLTAKIAELTEHSRKWEGRAKENKTAAEKLAELERAQMSEAERLAADAVKRDEDFAAETARANSAEAALARLNIAIEFGLDKDDAAALESVTDEAALRLLAERLSGRSTSTPTRPNASQGNRREAVSGGTTRDKFAEALDSLLN